MQDATGPKHLLEVIVKSTSETIPRWSPQSTAVIFTGLSLEPGGKVSAPGRKAYNILICRTTFPGLAFVAPCGQTDAMARLRR